MKKLYITGGIVTLSTIILVSTVSLLDKPEQETSPETDTKTSISTTTTTSTTQSNNTSDTATSAKGDAVATTAEYVDFDADAFKQATDKTRILFFYDSEHTPSVALDKLIAQHLAELPSDTVIFNILPAVEYELAEHFGITQPGAALRIDSSGQVTHIYIAPATPDITGFRTTLGLQ